MIDRLTRDGVDAANHAFPREIGRPASWPIPDDDVPAGEPISVRTDGKRYLQAVHEEALLDLAGHSKAGRTPSSRPIWLRLTPSVRRRRMSRTALNSGLNERRALDGASAFPDDGLTEHLRISNGEASTKPGQL